MKCLSIQLQPELDGNHDEKEVISLAKSIGRYPEVDSSDDDGRYVNLNFFTENLTILWKELKSGVLENKELGDWVRRVSIIVCEGENGWDDYLLLSHYDKSENIDEF